MIASIGNTTMLYCPKCRRTYEEGSRRFCENDGGRLLPAPQASRPTARSGGVFTNLIARSQDEKPSERKTPSVPRFIPLNKTDDSDRKLTSFPSAGRIFQSENVLGPPPRPSVDDDFLLELDPIAETEPDDNLLELETGPLEPLELEPRPEPRLIDPREIASGTAEVGDRRANPPGREALTRENPRALVGQLVKGRYLVQDEQIRSDGDSLLFVAEDQIADSRRVLVRVLMDDGIGKEDAEEKILFEERVSLSHLNHPNIAGVFDSGELPEGKSFIVSEYVDGKTLAEMLAVGPFNPLRTARIIRQTSYALSEAHQNGVLHRNIRPENIMLTVSEAGIEQIKLLNFGLSRGDAKGEPLAFKAPEEIDGGFSTYASDIFALAVVGYRMLTGRLPFEANSQTGLLAAQRRGVETPVSEIRTDVQPLVDKILEKAFAVSSADRYPKARDFGDAFFNALTTVAPWSGDSNDDSSDDTDVAAPTPETARTEATAVTAEPIDNRFVVIPAINNPATTPVDAPVAADIHITPDDDVAPESADVKSADADAWTRRSPEPPQTGISWRGWAMLAGVIALLAVLWAVSKFVFPPQPPELVSQPVQTETPVVPVQENVLQNVDADMAPARRDFGLQPEFKRFQNRREDLKGDLAKNFLGFQVDYPEGWILTPVPTAYLDVARKTGGFPIEQFLVTKYESRGTMTLDRPTFPKLVAKSNADLKKSFGDTYRVLGESEVVIQNGRWKAYEVKFSGVVSRDGKPVTVWGKRLWIPVQQAGHQSGFVVTMLATSLSEEVTSVDEVGIKGELADVLGYFEPEEVK